MVRLEKTNLDGTGGGGGGGGIMFGGLQKKRSRSSLDYTKPKKDLDNNEILIADYTSSASPQDDTHPHPDMSESEILSFLQNHPELANKLLRDDERAGAPINNNNNKKRPTSSPTKRSRPTASRKDKLAGPPTSTEREIPYLQWGSLILLLIGCGMYYYNQKMKTIKKKQQQQKNHHHSTNKTRSIITSKPRTLRLPEDAVIDDLKDAVVQQPRRPKKKIPHINAGTHSNNKKQIKTSITTTTKEEPKTLPVIKATTTTNKVETAEFEVGEWTTVIKKAKAGETDVNGGATANPEQQQQDVVQNKLVGKEDSSMKKTAPKKIKPKNKTKSSSMPPETKELAVTVTATISTATDASAATTVTQEEPTTTTTTDPTTANLPPTPSDAMPVHNGSAQDSGKKNGAIAIINGGDITTVVDNDNGEFMEPAAIKKKKDKKKKKKKSPTLLDGTIELDMATANDAALAIQLQLEEDRLGAETTTTDGTNPQYLLESASVVETATPAKKDDEWEEVTTKKKKKATE